MAYRILLVEDDRQIREVIEDYFSDKSEETITVVTAQDGRIGLELIREEEFDLIMLDIMLPYVDGFTLCREIRSKSIVLILFLTARAMEQDILYGYELGCDDYLVKPFSLAELYAKTNALLKRSKGMVIHKELVCGKISLNLITLQVTVEGVPIELAPKEFALLKYMMEHKNWVVDRDTLLDRIWGYDYFGGDRVVDNHIKKLRKALGSAGSQIKTVITKGYKLNITALAEELYSKYRINAENRGIKVQMEGTCTISADKAMFSQALENLIANAVKFTPDNGKIEISMSKRSICISNNCTAELFGATDDFCKPFSKGDNSRSNRTGSGIGLATVQNIMALHGFGLNISAGNGTFVVDIFFKG